MKEEKKDEGGGGAADVRGARGYCKMHPAQNGGAQGSGVLQEAVID